MSERQQSERDNRIVAVRDLGEYLQAQLTLIEVSAEDVAADIGVAVEAIGQWQQQSDPKVFRVPANMNDRGRYIFTLMRDAIEGTFSGAF